MSTQKPPLFSLDPAPRVITFDCYGMLVQWYKVLLREVEITLAAHGAENADAMSILGSFSAQGGV